MSNQLKTATAIKPVYTQENQEEYVSQYTFPSVFTPLEYLKIDIATNFGLDKEDWPERIQWTNAQNWDSRLADMSDQEFHQEMKGLLTQAEEPALFFAGVQALREALRGQSTGYPVSLDASTSVLQILSCLTGCMKSAKLCGIVSTGHRADAYMTLYQEMLNRMTQKKIPMVGQKLARIHVKEAIMTALT